MRTMVVLFPVAHAFTNEVSTLCLQADRLLYLRSAVLLHCARFCVSAAAVYSSVDRWIGLSGGRRDLLKLSSREKKGDACCYGRGRRQLGDSAQAAHGEPDG